MFIFCLRRYTDDEVDPILADKNVAWKAAENSHTLGE